MLARCVSNRLGIHAGTDMSLTDWLYMLARCVSNRLGIHAGQVCL